MEWESMVGGDDEDDDEDEDDDDMDVEVEDGTVILGGNLLVWSLSNKAVVSRRPEPVKGSGTTKPWTGILVPSIIRNINVVSCCCCRRRRRRCCRDWSSMMAKVRILLLVEISTSRLWENETIERRGVMEHRFCF
jgi:hypothetical protein